MPERSADWLAQAERDLELARHDLQGEFYEWACFVAQQGAEKAVKGLFEHLHGEAWGHSVSGLLAALPENVSPPEDLLEKARDLDRYYIQPRYPNGFAVGALARRPDRGDSFGGLVEAAPLDFSGPDGLCRSMQGAGVLYNTYWVRYAHGQTTFDRAVENTRTLFEAAERAGVGRVVHFSVANASTESRLPYLRGKAHVEDMQ